jgi:hypothetical protein
MALKGLFRKKSTRTIQQVVMEITLNSHFLTVRILLFLGLPQSLVAEL